MSRIQLVLLTAMVMVAFAANSLLCREALSAGHIGAASFTFVRITSGAAILSLLLLVKFPRYQLGGSWLSAAALFVYAAAFSFSYISLSAGTGALLLFGAVQTTMIVYGLWAGERLTIYQMVGAVAAGGGIVWLMLPGIESPPLLGAILMLLSGVSWGAYSLLGRGTADPTAATAGNFMRAVPFAVILVVVLGNAQVTWVGAAYAFASGALASGMGYALWYAVLPALAATTAATIQLSVPVIAAFGGVLLLGEAVTPRFGLASIAVLGGVLLFVASKQKA
ncbi:DMT family transporter [Zhongshania arctica]|uniref:DMT family transporter n=1 Tax=Zhongshania arctica TaxID=3238302 RepID=A0ABV3TZR6_9GAMM